jgi:glycosyltransferase involved in cell wall biosynthesis
MLTVVMPSLNQARFLEEAVTSVMTQSEPLELIVVDGGSSDNTLSLLAALASRWPGRLRWQSAPDSGPAAAVNEGIALARGDIIGWLNADDRYMPDAARRALSLFEGMPSLQMVYGEAEHIDDAGRVLGRYPSAPPTVSMEHFFEGCFICQPTAFFRRSTFLALGGLDESLAASFDFDLWVRWFKFAHDAVGFVPALQAQSRLHAQTITARQRETVALEGMKVLHRHLGQSRASWLLTHFAERCQQHPFAGAGVDLTATFSEMVARAADWLSPTDVQVLKLTIANNRALDIASPNLYADIWPDGWAGKTLEIRFRQPASPARALLLRGRHAHPHAGMSRLSAATPSGFTPTLRLTYPGPFQWELPIHDQRPGAQLVYRITTDRTFVPAELDPFAEDRRSLSFVVESIQLHA